jgi:uncharacterized protein HemX
MEATTVTEEAVQARSKAVAILATLIVVFLAVTGVFGVLWLEERSDHKAETSQLDTTRAESSDSEAKQQAAEKLAEDQEKQIVRSADQKHRDEGQITADKPCVEAGKEFAGALLTPGTPFVSHVSEKCGNR